MKENYNGNCNLIFEKEQQLSNIVEIELKEELAGDADQIEGHGQGEDDQGRARALGQTVLKPRLRHHQQ